VPLEVTLEFLRKEKAADAYAFQFGTQEYLLRSGEGGYHSASLTWDDELLGWLGDLQRPRPSKAVPKR
jgi:hypothetical protein